MGPRGRIGVLLPQHCFQATALSKRLLGASRLSACLPHCSRLTTSGQPLTECVATCLTVPLSIPLPMSTGDFSARTSDNPSWMPTMQAEARKVEASEQSQLTSRGFWVISQYKMAVVRHSALWYPGQRVLGKFRLAEFQWILAFLCGRHALRVS